MSILQFVWFLLIGVLFSAFFFLDGFDLGVGMSVQTLAHDEDEKTQILHSIGPFWDGNEVWLLTAGGAMFAAFPFWYSSLFSGYYIILLFILTGLILRGVSIEFRSKMPTKYKNIWNWTMTIGSFIVPFMFGILFISMIQGMPISANGNIYGHFTNYINVFSIVGGIALTLICYLHGLNYIALKTKGDIRERARNYSELLYWVLYVGLVIFAILLVIKTNLIQKHPVIIPVLLLVIVFLSIIGHSSVFKGKELIAFISTGLILVILVALIFCGLFPNVMIAENPAHNLLIANASSSPYTLKIMTIAACSILPFILAYTIWAYYIFRKRISVDEIKDGGY